MYAVILLADRGFANAELVRYVRQLYCLLILLKI
jgi:hypothetical protein